MDLDLLKHHAERNGRWTARLTKHDKIECHFNQRDGHWYVLNGKPITDREAEKVLDEAFVAKMKTARPKRAA